MWISSSDDCVVDGNCVTSKNYPAEYGNSESCTLTYAVAGNLTIETFNTEYYFDKLTINGYPYHGSGSYYQPPEGLFLDGRAITWSSNSYGTSSGFKICMGPELGTEASLADDGMGNSARQLSHAEWDQVVCPEHTVEGFGCSAAEPCREMCVNQTTSYDYYGPYNYWCMVPGNGYDYCLTPSGSQYCGCA